MAAVPPRLTRRSRLILALCVLGVLCGSDYARTQAAPRRIISLIPATTEMLFAMGASDRIVGVGTFDRFPPEVSRFPRVGGLLDPNVERMLALKPDLVIVYETQTNLIGQLTRAGVPMFRYQHQGLPDIVQTVRSLGTRIGAAKEADAAAGRIEARLADVRRRVEGRSRPRTLAGLRPRAGIAAPNRGERRIRIPARSAGARRRQRRPLRLPAAVGRDEHRDGAGPRAGGDHRAPVRRFARAASRSTPRRASGTRSHRFRRCGSKQVHLLVGDEFVVPGPRIVQAAERFARVLHPDVFK